MIFKIIFKDHRLEKITNELISSLLVNIYKISKEEAYNKINTVINNGLAAEKFEMMVAGLGGPKNILSSYEKDLINTSVRKDVFSSEEGWIEKIYTRELGLILIELGGGRKQVTDKIDYGVGYNNVLNIGDEVNSSTPLLSIYSNKNIDDNLINKIQSCFIISDKKTHKLSEIFETIK